MNNILKSILEICDEEYSSDEKITDIIKLINKIVPMKKLTYNCKQNDAVIELVNEDGKIGEIHVKIKSESGYTVIGFIDLENAIAKAKKAFNPDGYKVCSSCGRKFIQTEAKNKMFCCVACDMGY